METLEAVLLLLFPSATKGFSPVDCNARETEACPCPVCFSNSLSQQDSNARAISRILFLENTVELDKFRKGRKKRCPRREQRFRTTVLSTIRPRVTPESTCFRAKPVRPRIKIEGLSRKRERPSTRQGSIRKKCPSAVCDESPYRNRLFSPNGIKSSDVVNVYSLLNPCSSH